MTTTTLPTYTTTPTGFKGSIQHTATVTDFETIRPCRYSWCRSHTIRPERDELIYDGTEPMDADGWQWIDNRSQRIREHVVESPSQCFAMSVHEYWTPGDGLHVIQDVNVDADLAYCYSREDIQVLAGELNDLARIAQTVTLP